MDGYSSHITANVIVYYIEHIDLLILPPHTSYVLQPLGLSVFSLLNRALAIETDAASQVDAGRISRIEWTSMYRRARQYARRSPSVLCGFRTTGP
jgi:hypothetical protein